MRRPTAVTLALAFAALLLVLQLALLSRLSQPLWSPDGAEKLALRRELSALKLQLQDELESRGRELSALKLQLQAELESRAGADRLQFPYVNGRERTAWLRQFPIFANATSLEVHRDDRVKLSRRDSQSAGGDYVLPPRLYKTLSPLPTRGLRVLVLTDEGHRKTLMDQWFYEYVDTLAEHPWIQEVTVFGPASPGWTSAAKPPPRDVANEVLRHFPASSIPFDVVMTHNFLPKPEISSGIAEVFATFEHELQCFEGLDRCGPSKPLKDSHILHFAYANTGIYLGNYTDSWQFQGGTKSANGPIIPEEHGKALVHTPVGIDADLFSECVVEGRRPLDVLLIGKTQQDLYPLRTRLAAYFRHGAAEGDELRNGTQYRVEIRGHPGYEVLFSSVLKEFASRRNGSGDIRDQVREFVLEMSKTKIILVTPSVRNFALRKYFEAAAAGALVVGPVPAERQREIASWLVPIPHDASWEVIRDTLRYWLTHDEERVARARLGQWYVFSRLTWQHICHKTVGTWIEYYYEFLRGLHVSADFSLPRPWCLPYKRHGSAATCGYFDPVDNPWQVNFDGIPGGSRASDRNYVWGD